MAETQSERPLPDGWAQATIGEIAEQINSGFPSGKHNTEGIGVPHLRPMNISPNGEIDLSLVKYVEVSDYDALQKGDVLFNNTNSAAWLGKTAYIKKDTNWAYSNHMTRVRLHPGFDSGWVAYALHHQFLIGFFRMNCRHHVNQASINTNFLSTQTAIPIPPLPEQRRIVAEIETQFTRLDAGVAALERAQANLRRYKASVLKAACEGRLVPTEAELARAEGRGYEPAGQLLARILAERRAKWEAEHPGKKYKEPASPDTENMLELPERWVWGKFEQLISSFRSGSSAVPQNEPTDFPILRSSSVRPLRLDCNDVRFVTEADSQRADNFLQEDDLLFTRLSGSLDYVGNCALVKGTESRGIQYPDRQFRAQLVEQGMGQYVEICFASSQLRKEITAQAKSTAGHQRISMGGIREQVLPLPPLAEQRRIVAEVERRLSVVAALEASVEAALARARRLRQAVLKRAFEGQLVPQDPDDEPASVLLERIRARRETGKKAGETNRKKKQLQQLELL